jgi:hypothetical protein
MFSVPRALARLSRGLTLGVALAAVLVVAGRAAAITITMDYSNDLFFNNPAHAAAKASLEAAATDIGSLLTSTLGKVTDTSTGSAGGSSATFDFHLTYTNPTTNAQVTVDPVSLAQNQFTIFVGVQKLTGTTAGQGGPGGFGFTAGGLFDTQANFTNAVHNAQTAANANVGRGSGPVISRLSGSFTDNNMVSYPYTLTAGSMIGNLWFDDDTNNDGVVDSDTQLNSYWQFDHTAPVPAGKLDFYSVAEHEILHSLGFSSSQSFTDDVSTANPRNWVGPAGGNSQVISLLGSGIGVLQPDSAHITEGLMSTRLSDGAAQEALMDPTLTTGQRKTVTRLDLAFLRDIGWQTEAYPLLKGDFNQDNLRTATDIDAMFKALTNLPAYESQFGVQPQNLLTIADINGDNVFNNLDIQAMLALLQTDALAGAPTLQSVPEPGSLLLAAVGASLLMFKLKSRRRIQHAGADFF